MMIALSQNNWLFEEATGLAQKYGFNCYEIHSNLVRIRSICDEWLIEYVQSPKKPFYLHHYKDKPHLQRKFYDLPFLFKSLFQHDIFVLNGRTTVPIKKFSA
ncbi:hypothetical protein Calow_0033 [Caldicellulosiruptor owensensis OL]|uniref:Uncharacterized protein n=2 Tax=Caldicellulosiruptor owensensis TaxID=55205 RepID=E4Q1V4_CALOW|nr:hypothetical protein Calow_0033 [Caldicellulosiruptor owensensis OL]